MNNKRSSILIWSKQISESSGRGRTMEERRVRRYGRGQTNTLLPLRTAETRIRRLSNTISCWYCDYKISALNVPLFRFGRRHAGFLRVWFSIGVGFTLTALVVVTLVIYHLQSPVNPSFWSLFVDYHVVSLVYRFFFGY